MSRRSSPRPSSSSSAPSPIRGFATTLAIGLLANVFTAVFVSRTLFEVALDAGRSRSTLGIGGSQLFANTRANFTRWRWHALALSLVVIGAGVATVITRGLTLGIDFSGGTLVVVEFTQDGVTEEQVRAAVSGCPAMRSCSATAPPPNASS